MRRQGALVLVNGSRGNDDREIAVGRNFPEFVWPFGHHQIGGHHGCFVDGPIAAAWQDEVAHPKHRIVGRVVLIEFGFGLFHQRCRSQGEAHLVNVLTGEVLKDRDVADSEIEAPVDGSSRIDPAVICLPQEIDNGSNEGRHVALILPLIGNVVGIELVVVVHQGSSDNDAHHRNDQTCTQRNPRKQGAHAGGGFMACTELQRPRCDE